MTNIRERRVVEINSVRFDQLEKEVQELKKITFSLKRSVIGKLAELQFVLSNIHKFYQYPEWIDTNTALEIMQIKDKRTLNDQVDNGLIECKPVGRMGSGHRYMYRKSDCISWAANRAAMLMEEVES